MKKRHMPLGNTSIRDGYETAASGIAERLNISHETAKRELADALTKVCVIEFISEHVSFMRTGE